jgi:hypothetical protein
MQIDNTDAGPSSSLMGLYNSIAYVSIVYDGGGYSLLTSRLLLHVDFRSASFKGNFIHG